MDAEPGRRSSLGDVYDGGGPLRLEPRARALPTDVIDGRPVDPGLG